MKFAKELEHELVPEWKAKYLDYKKGKKKLKAVARALRSVNQSPSTPRARRRAASSLLSRSPFTPRYTVAQPPPTQAVPRSWLRRGESEPSDAQESARGLREHAVDPGEDGGSGGSSADGDVEAEERRDRFASPPMSIPQRPGARDGGVRPGESNLRRNYGSIIATPPNESSDDMAPGYPPDLELPDPALDPDKPGPVGQRKGFGDASIHGKKTRKESRPATSAYEAGVTNHPKPSPINKRFFGPRRVNSTPGWPTPPDNRPLMHRMLSVGGPFVFGKTKLDTPRDVPLEAYREFDMRQQEFFAFLDSELDKIETFYKTKEEEATHRLQVLREQLHEMRDRRLEEVIAAQRIRERRSKGHKSEGELSGLLSRAEMNGGESSDNDGKHIPGLGWVKPLGEALNPLRPGTQHYGKTTKTLMEQAGIPHGKRAREIAEGAQQLDSRRDFVRRAVPGEVIPYRQAKRKLKMALQEYYRGLELLKSYALLNRTAFRKLNKKYDKTLNARPTGQYMAEKVNKAWFVQSEVVDHHIQTVEDLYARYFERGNHKIAVGKLRSKDLKPGAFSENSFRNGAWIAAALVFGIQGLVYGSNLLKVADGTDPTLSTQTSYLLQIYGGYFLMLLLVLLFCLDCGFWARNKINYAFVFEFDTRNNLDWKQLAEIPCFCLFLLGLFMWLNFQQYGGSSVYVYYPVMLIGITAIVLFFPAPLFYHKSRQWFLYSHWRLLLAGLYPVEFRDFFLGDMYCSMVYSMGNLELFFCLYAHHWNDPPQCNSSHSRLLGFFTTLPGLWRLFQCFRRYYDTRNIFPHLVNGGKYTFTSLYYLSLSLYRINKSTELRAVFIVFALLNAIYTSVWDLAMDWSLGNPYARYPFLRDVLGYKQPWIYYAAMFLDPVLRFQWIFYAIYASDVQHSAALSFFVSLAEVLRRAMWTVFRVENEHCTNVGRFRASRDVPLPYEIEDHHGAPEVDAEADKGLRPSPVYSGKKPDRHTPDAATTEPTTAVTTASQTQQPPTKTPDLEAAGTRSPGSLRLRPRRSRPSQPNTPLLRGISRVGTAMAEAHAQDFERKRRPEAGDVVGPHDSEDEDADGADDEETESLRRAEREDEDDEARVGMGMSPAERAWRREREEDALAGRGVGGSAEG